MGKHSIYVRLIRLLMPDASPPAFVERRTIPIYALLVVVVLGITGAVYLTDFTYDHASLDRPLACLAALCACGCGLLRVGYPRLGGLLEASTQITALSCAAAWATVLLAATALPLADPLLARADALLFLGFDWCSLLPFIAGQNKLMTFLSYAYASISWQPGMILVALFASGKCGRSWTFVLAWGVTLAISAALFPLLPALGTYLHFGIPSGDVPGILVPAAWRHVELLLPVRDGHMRSISPDALYGIVTFPSFHAAAAVLLGWAGWALRPLRWPCVLLNGAMFASALIIGGHYLIDLAAGGVIAAAAILASASLAAHFEKGPRQVRSRKAEDLRTYSTQSRPMSR